MEEDNSIQLTTSSGITSLVVTVWCEHWVHEGEGECNHRCTFLSFTSANHQARWALEGHHSCPYAHNRNSSWFYKWSRVQKSYSRRHKTRPTNASSHEWLGRVKKRLSSTFTRLEDLQSRDQCTAWYTLQGTHTHHSWKLHNRTLQTICEGYLSIEEMQPRVEGSVFWSKIMADILQTAQSCKVCQTFSRIQQTEILMPHEVPQEPWEKIGADFFQFESTNYLLIADYYSQFPIIRRMMSTMSNATIDMMK